MTRNTRTSRNLNWEEGLLKVRCPWCGRPTAGVSGARRLEGERSSGFEVTCEGCGHDYKVACGIGDEGCWVIVVPVGILPDIVPCPWCGAGPRSGKGVHEVETIGVPWSGKWSARCGSCGRAYRVDEKAGPSGMEVRVTGQADIVGILFTEGRLIDAEPTPDYLTLRVYGRRGHGWTDLNLPWRAVSLLVSLLDSKGGEATVGEHRLKVLFTPDGDEACLMLDAPPVHLVLDFRDEQLTTVIEGLREVEQTFGPRETVL